jgi:lipid A 3-O-deacylase
MVIKLARMKIFISIALLFVLFCTPCMSFAQDETRPAIATADNQLTFSAGYGEAIPGFGHTHTRVRDADFILKYGYFLTKELGDSWYKGRHQIVFELPFYYVTTPRSAVMTGINVLAYWHFTGISRTVVPYIFGGGGAIYTNLNLPDMGSRYNGNFQGGAGFNYFLSRNIAIDFNARYHHISNAGSASPNMPLNSVKAMIGISHFW